MENKRILLVSPQGNIWYNLKESLQKEGYDVLVCTNGESALDYFSSQVFELCLISVDLPDMCGFDIGRFLDLHHPEVSYIFLNSNQHSISRLEGLRIVANDYITLPFNIEEVILWVNNLLGRINQKKNS